MKKTILLLSILFLSLSGYAQTPWETVDFSFSDFAFRVPAESRVELQGNRATVQNEVLQFGLSLSLDKTARASVTKTEGLCRRLATNMKVKGTPVAITLPSGLCGSAVYGELEEAAVAVNVFSTPAGYLSIIGVSTPTEFPQLLNVIETAAYRKVSTF